jgi:hypothetical protein
MIFSKKAVFLAKMVVHFSEKNRIYAKVILAELFILQLMILLVCNKKARNCSYLTTISDFLMLVIYIIIYGRQAGTQSAEFASAQK